MLQLICGAQANNVVTLPAIKINQNEKYISYKVLKNFSIKIGALSLKQPSPKYTNGTLSSLAMQTDTACTNSWMQDVGVEMLMYHCNAQ